MILLYFFKYWYNIRMIVTYRQDCDESFLYFSDLKIIEIKIISKGYNVVVVLTLMLRINHNNLEIILHYYQNDSHNFFLYL